MNNVVYGQQYLGSVPSLYGFRIDSISNTSLNIFGGVARAINSDWTIFYPNNSPDLPYFIFLDLTKVGLNGCYPNPLSQITPGSGLAFVTIMAIGDSSGQNNPGVIAATATTGFLPPGYDSYRPVNMFIINSSGQAVNMVQSGMFSERNYMLGDGIQILSSGNATSATTLDLVALTGVLPSKPLVSSVTINYKYAPASTTQFLHVVPSGLTSSTHSPVTIGASTSAGVSSNFIMPPGYNTAATNNASIDYFVDNSSDTVSLWLSGFSLSFDLSLV